MSTLFGANIAGTGSYLPEKRLTNDDLSRMVETNDEWIIQRLSAHPRGGILPRPEANRTATLATASRPQGPRRPRGMEAKEIDLIVARRLRRRWSSLPPPVLSPPPWASTARRHFDLSAACSGIYVAHWLLPPTPLKIGQCRNVMVIGCETLSRVTDYTDRASCILFGDGAGAVILRRETDPRRGLIYNSLHADGNGAEVMKLMPGSRHPISPELINQRQQFMQLRGREVYKFAVIKFEELIRQAMRACGTRSRRREADCAASGQPADHRLGPGKAEHKGRKR